MYRCIGNKRKGESTWSQLKFVLEVPATSKGSNEVVTILQELIKEKGWEDQVNVKGAFCMQVCTQGLGLRVNGKQLLGVGLHNVKEVLLQEITAALA